VESSTSPRNFHQIGQILLPYRNSPRRSNTFLLEFPPEGQVLLPRRSQVLSPSRSSISLQESPQNVKNFPPGIPSRKSQVLLPRSSLEKVKYFLENPPPQKVKHIPSGGRKYIPPGGQGLRAST